MGKLSKKMVDLNQRLLVSAIAILVVAFLIFFSHNWFVNWLLVLTIGSLAGVGVWEYAQLAKAKGLAPAARLMIVVAVSEVLAFYVSMAYPVLSKLALLTMVLGVIAFFIAHFRRINNSLSNIAVELFGVCYLAIPLSFMLAILYPFYHGSVVQDGRWWLVYLVVVTKITDVGGILLENYLANIFLHRN
jgi:phosphatidate cytidylyltransferase